MQFAKFLFGAYLRRREGNIGLIAAITAPVVILSTAMGADFAQVSMQRRTLQQHADLAAISAASNIDNAEAEVAYYFANNRKSLGVVKGSKMITQNGEVAFDQDIAFSTYGGYATLIKGRYAADASVPPANRFVAGALPSNAVKVIIREKPGYYFLNGVSDPPKIESQGVATAQKVASFSVGTRLASLNGGLLNSVLGSMLGTTLTLSVMDYQALLDADINVLKIADALGTNLGLTAATYSKVLDTDITYGQFLTALKGTQALDASSEVAVNKLIQATKNLQTKFKLGKVVNLDIYGGRITGNADSLAAKAAVFELVSATALVANGTNQVKIDVSASLPALASAKLEVAIGQAPVGTPSLAVGATGTIIRTAQTRIALTVATKTSSLLNNLGVTLPIYVEVAYAEAKLSKITCYGSTSNNASVEVEAVPGIVGLSLGTIDTTAMANFSSKPVVTNTTLVNALLLKINGKGHVEATNMSKKTLQFLPSEIQSREMKSVSTSDTLTSLTTSLFANLDLEIQTLILTLSTPKQVQAALAQVLAVAAVPVDDALYNTLLMLGIRVGEADVRVTGVSCKRPVLVN